MCSWLKHGPDFNNCGVCSLGVLQITRTHHFLERRIKSKRRSFWGSRGRLFYNELGFQGMCIFSWNPLMAHLSVLFCAFSSKFYDNSWNCSYVTLLRSRLASTMHGASCIINTRRTKLPPSLWIPMIPKVKNTSNWYPLDKTPSANDFGLQMVCARSHSIASFLFAYIYVGAIE